MDSAVEGLVSKHGADDCIFCKIRDRKIPSYPLLETPHALAFLDAFPMAKGHCLLIPKKHSPFMEDMEPEDAAAVLKELPRLAKALRKATGATGINIVQNNGAPAGQVVFHVHFHLIPRFDGDELVRFAKSGPMIDSGVANEVKSAILAALPASAL
eukprot:TRINITY_DN2405_c0_g1_i2.p1 TRINITY_DN2405_c0_g1~~TRINITY_DN2405_c0_g1_i2.p1  ORF type:complete len:156 (-),score=38.15 TRINITY_DN2405_c0_g1_i2:696-1163(-)